MNEPESLLRGVPLAAPSDPHERQMEALFDAAYRSAVHRRRPSPLASLVLLGFGAAAACLTALVSHGTTAQAAVVYDFEATPAIQALLSDPPTPTHGLPPLEFEAEPAPAPSP